MVWTEAGVARILAGEAQPERVTSESIPVNDEAFREIVCKEGKEDFVLSNVRWCVGACRLHLTTYRPVIIGFARARPRAGQG